MSRNKITIVSIYYPPERGAAASRVSKMATGLLARNIDVNVITALPNHPTGRIFAGYHHRIAHHETIDDVPVRRYWLYPSNSAVALKRVLNMVSFSATLFLSLPFLLRNRPGTIIINSPPLLVGFSGVVLAKILRTRVITNISDIWPKSALELGAIQRGWFYSLLEKIEDFLYRQSDAIMVQSNETRQHVTKSHPDKRTFLYRNLDYASEFSDQYPTVGGQTTRIVYAGLLGVAQGVYEICSAVEFEKLGVEFHIYGDGNEKNMIEQYISDNPNTNVFLHDTVPNSQIPRLLADFHATIIPLRREIHGAFPSKIYMAISAALPVLFCGAGEGARFVRDTRIGWVSGPRDYSGLSDHIKGLVEMSSSEYASLRDRVKSLAAGTYDLDDQLDRLVAFVVNTIE